MGAAALALAQDRAENRQATHGTRLRSGHGTLGGGTNQRLAQRTETDARTLGSTHRSPRRLESIGNERYLFPTLVRVLDVTELILKSSVLSEVLRSADGQFVSVGEVCDGGYEEAVYN